MAPYSPELHAPAAAVGYKGYRFFHMRTRVWTRSIVERTSGRAGRRVYRRQRPVGQCLDVRFATREGREPLAGRDAAPASSCFQAVFTPVNFVGFDVSYLTQIFPAVSLIHAEDRRLVPR